MRLFPGRRASACSKESSASRSRFICRRRSPTVQPGATHPRAKGQDVIEREQGLVSAARVYGMRAPAISMTGVLPGSRAESAVNGSHGFIVIIITVKGFSHPAPGPGIPVPGCKVPCIIGREPDDQPGKNKELPPNGYSTRESPASIAFALSSAAFAICPCFRLAWRSPFTYQLTALFCCSERAIPMACRASSHAPFPDKFRGLIEPCRHQAGIERYRPVIRLRSICIP